jgi:UDP-N-acetylglucosamine 2-epimerase
MKIVSVVGARPQFVKLWPVSRALRRRHIEVIVNTGQHYDFEMSGAFIRDMDIARPDHNLEVGSGSHAEQTGRMLMGLEKVFIQERPDAVLVFGDTNSTIAAALAAAKLHMPVAHVEAGLRSYNRDMPEEINRVLTDHLSAWLFCPTQTAQHNLAREGITTGVSRVGDVMLDAVLHFSGMADASGIFEEYGLERGRYLLATIHRASNTDSTDALATLLAAFGAIDEPIAFPVHPRTRRALDAAKLTLSSNVRPMNPVGYLEMLALEKHARMVLTDSGGMQKEAFFFGVPCLTLRTETEWTELVEAGWNRVVGLDRERIVEAVRAWMPDGPRPDLFGKGDASERIAALLERD